MRSGYTTRRHVAAARRRASAPPTTCSACARAGSRERRRARASPRPTCATASSPAAASSPSIPEHRLIHRRAARRAADAARAAALLRSFADLRTGDIVVHEDHGLARFAGFDTKTVAGVTRDYLDLEFAGHRPRLHAGRPAREDLALRRRRRRAPAALQARRHALGHDQGARPPRRPGARRRAAQPLRRAQPPRAATRSRPTPTGCASSRPPSRTRETPDQREAIEQVKGDMEAERPMDRLICGDVGYGKTEVALRAAFKAANAGKQVLMLVPTTILAQQHFGTFTERLRDYPFTIEHVSRFRAAGRAARRRQALLRGQGRHPHRHAPAALARRAREGPRAADRRRGAALRRQAEGAAAPAAAQGRRDLDERDADPAHAADVARRAARHLRDRDAARGPPAGQDLRRRVRRGARQAGARAREGARRPGVLPPQPRRGHRRDGRAPARAVPGHVASRSPTARWTRSSSRSA